MIHKRFGFTIIEISIVVVILATLLTIGIVSFRGAKEDQALQKDALSLKSYLKNAQSYASKMSSVVVLDADTIQSASGNRTTYTPRMRMPELNEGNNRMMLPVWGRTEDTGATSSYNLVVVQQHDNLRVGDTLTLNSDSGNRKSIFVYPGNAPIVIADITTQHGKEVPDYKARANVIAFYNNDIGYLLQPNGGGDISVYKIKKRQGDQYYVKAKMNF